MLDDFPHRMTFLPEFRFPGGPRGDWDLFRFQGSDLAYFEHHREMGLWPWWTTPTLRLAFFRPLSSLHHALDYRLWPSAAWLMHLESMLLFGLLALAVAKLYRRLLGATVLAGLGAVMFAIDDAHSMVVMWIANRNALWAVLFGVLSLLCFVRYRAGDFPHGRWLGPLCFGLGLLAGETTVGAAAYLFSYVMWLEKGPLLSRLRLLLPYVLLGGVWAAAYGLMGYGSIGSGMYVDPIREPLAYLSMVVVRLPLLLLGQLALPPADLWMQVAPAVLPKLATIAWLLLSVFGYLSYRLLRGDRLAAFLAMGMVLSLLPVCSAWPGDRLLLIAGIGAFGLVAKLLGRLWEQLLAATFTRRAASRLGIAAIVLIHVVLASLLLPLRIGFLRDTFGSLVPRAAASLPKSELWPGRTLVMVNAPDPLVATYSVSYRYLQDHKLGHSLRLLSVALRGSLRITSSDDHTLTLELSEGFIQEPLSRVFRSPSLPMKPGEQIQLSDLTVRVLSMSTHGTPQQVSFSFRRPLHDPAHLWVIWKERGFASFTPPPVGQTITLPAIDYQVALGMK
jgi:hypothetical protein